MGAFLVGKIATAFFALQRRQPHPLAAFVLAVYQDVFAGVKHDRTKLLVLLRASDVQLMEHAMMVDDSSPTKALIFDVFDAVYKSEIYRGCAELQAVCGGSLRTVTSKHLAYFSSYFFG